jgi:predicted O-linked N-acetylglucosamine transferase (SPINDLY family)
VRRALALDPALAEAYRALGSLAIAARRWQDALLAFERGLELDPGMLVVRAQHYGVAQTLAYWDRWHERVAQIVDGAERSPQATDPMRLMLAIDDPALLRRCADRMAAYHAERAGPWSTTTSRATGPARRRLRIGYLSGDLREHPVAQLLAGVIEHHDRDQVEVCCYALGPPSGSAWRARIEAASERVVGLEGVTEEQIAARLAADDLDLLVDLMGHTEPGVPRVLAARPAALQVGWLGYPGTLGAGLCDYLIADPIVVPSGAEGGYAEAIARMPHCLLPGDRSRIVSVPRTRRELGLPDAAVVLCCFAQVQKITPVAFDAWMQAMRACPDAVLWLARPVDEAIENLAREAEARGVARQRIVYAERAPDPADHLARYEIADVALDTFPYGSHSTALDALWVGCPLVAYAGGSFQARVSASVLTAAGVPELVATDPGGYAGRIIALARDADARRRMRHVLRQARDASPLFDVARFTGDLEDLYARMHGRRIAGLAPAALER